MRASTGWGECFGPGPIAMANKGIVEGVIAPMVTGMDPLDRDVIWHKVYNLMRDHGQKGMPMQALSGVDIALWDIAGKVMGQPLYRLIGGAHRNRVRAYGYGMMLKRESVDDHVARFRDEAHGDPRHGLYRDQDENRVWAKGRCAPVSGRGRRR